MPTDDPRSTILYISYGSGIHEKEIAFSIYSIFYHAQNKPLPQILVYTDHVEHFEGIPNINLCYISPEQWSEWSGPFGYNHRRKILALQHAFANGFEKVLLVDGDTWFRRNASELLKRVSPGNSIMHIREGIIQRVNSSIYRDLTKLFYTPSDPVFEQTLGMLSSASYMWNAGVVGLHGSDSARLTDVVAITDMLCQKSKLHILEQFAFSWVLSRETNLSEGFETVFHYWPPYLHSPFRDKISSLLERAQKLPLRERIEFLYRNRPRPNMFRRGKLILKEIARFFGFFGYRARTNEW